MMAGTAEAQKVESLSAASPSGTALAVHIGGRTTSPDGKPLFTHQWPGVYWESRFTGAEVTAEFADPVNILHISIDGKLIDPVTKPGNSGIRISGLSDGPHDIRVEKATESQSVPATFKGFFVPQLENAQPLHIPRPRQIEFIGDSYTVGYGNTSSKRQCTKDEIWATTDTQQAFGPLTAKHFNADYQINAFSGRGIVRNYDGFIGDPLPALYPYALYDGKSEYNDPTWQPQIIMIALGGNDFSTPVHAGEKWHSLEDLRADYIASYVTFVKNLRARHPKASFLLADYGEPEIISDITEVIKRLNADGETRIAPFNAGSGFELTGCDYHLNTADDKRISATLIAYIDAHPELWQGK
jgi:lysophospholipase L1-like esterase